MWVEIKSTVGFAQQAIQNDIRRTLSRRFDFFVNSFNDELEGHGEAETEEEDTEIDLPKRVFIKMPDIGILFSDLMFHIDDVQDVLIQQSKQFLDVDLTENDFLVESELQGDSYHESSLRSIGSGKFRRWESTVVDRF